MSSIIEIKFGLLFRGLDNKIYCVKMRDDSGEWEVFQARIEWWAIETPRGDKSNE